MSLMCFRASERPVVERYSEERTDCFGRRMIDWVSNRFGLHGASQSQSQPRIMVGGASKGLRSILLAILLAIPSEQWEGP